MAVVLGSGSLAGGEAALLCSCGDVKSSPGHDALRGARHLLSASNSHGSPSLYCNSHFVEEKREVHRVQVIHGNSTS